MMRNLFHDKVVANIDVKRTHLPIQQANLQGLCECRDGTLSDYHFRDGTELIRIVIPLFQRRDRAALYLVSSLCFYLYILVS